MSEIDWSKAPEGATHWHPAAASWVKIEGGEIMLWLTQGGDNFWGKKSIYFPSYPISISSLISAPWYWEGHGLPPVGIVCEYKPTEEDQWIKIRVLGYDGEHMWCRALGSERSMVIYSFAALRKSIDDEVLAEDERELAIRQMMVDCDNAHARGVLEELYDAGYRKVEGGAE